MPGSLLPALTLSAVLLAASAASASAADPLGSKPMLVPMVTVTNPGRDHVQVWNDATTVYVRVLSKSGKSFTKNQIHADWSVDGIPQTGHRPDPDRFALQDALATPKTQCDYVAFKSQQPLEVGRALCIAVHSSLTSSKGASVAWSGTQTYPQAPAGPERYLTYVVQRLGGPVLPSTLNLPTQITFRATQPQGRTSYWAHDFMSFKDDDDRNDLRTGPQAAWCVAKTTGMATNGVFAATPRFSMGDQNQLPTRLQGLSANLTLVNYLIYHRGTASITDTQNAIWCLMDETTTPYSTLNTVAKALVDDALANGQNWTPDPSRAQAQAILMDAGAANQDTIVDPTGGGSLSTP